MTTTTELVNRLRILAKDTATSNYIAQETPKGERDGANVNFRFENINIVPMSVYVTQDTDFRNDTGFKVDYPNGIITFDAPPDPTTVVFCADYNFYFFSDLEYMEFLESGTDVLSMSDMTKVDSGLVPALLQFGLVYFYQARATSYAHRYSSSGGQVGQSVDVVTRNFGTLQERAFKMGVTLRDDFYKRAGQRQAPSSGSLSFKIDPYTPRR
jgi:hypothetical protein